jgi:uncharacterized membrane protein (Fun14 family)
MTEVTNEKVIPAFTKDADELNKRVGEAIDMSFLKLEKQGIIKVETKENFSLTENQKKYTTWIIFGVILLLAICIIFFYK